MTSLDFRQFGLASLGPLIILLLVASIALMSHASHVFLTIKHYSSLSQSALRLSDAQHQLDQNILDAIASPLAHEDNYSIGINGIRERTQRVAFPTNSDIKTILSQTLEQWPLFARLPNTGEFTYSSSSTLTELFGEHYSNTDHILAIADWRLPDCSGASAIEHVLIVIEGNCQVASGTTIGSHARPSVLLLFGGNLVMKPSSRIIGIVILIPRHHTKQIVTQGHNAYIEGALVIPEISTSSPLQVHYNQAVLETLNNLKRRAIVRPKPMSWRQQ